MDHFATKLSWFFKWLIVSTVHVSVLICLILAIKAVIRNRLAVRWHYWLWLLLLIRMLMPWAPQSSFSVFTLISQAKSSIVSEHIAKVTPSAPIVDVTANLTQDVIPRATVPPEGQDQVSFTATRPQTAPSPTSTPSLEIIGILSLLWLVVALALAVAALACNFKLWRIIRSQRPLTEGRILNALEDCKAEMGIQTILGVIVTDKVKSPALFGVVRPRLLLPEGIIETLTQEELRYVFLHELAHLKRRDIYLGWLMVILQVLHWFNPLVWLAFHRMRADRELACDGLVLSTMHAGESERYGTTMVNLLRGFSQVQYVPGIAGILENKSQLKRRITMIARFKKGSYRWSTMAVVLLTILGCVFLTNARGVSQTENKEPEVMAKEFVELLVKGQFSKAVEGFDAAMKKSLPTDKLAQTWRTTTGQAGIFKQQLGTRREKFLGSEIVFVTCEFEKGPMDVKVVYDSDNKVTGLWFVPTPQKVLEEYRGRAKVKPQVTPRRMRVVKLSYDDGSSEGRNSIAGGGHAVLFEAPGEGSILKSVRIYGSRYGYDDPPKEDFHIWLCDKDFEVIKDFSFPYSRFIKGKPKWVTLRVEPTPVPESFIICAGFNPERTKGVYVHYDDSSSGNSFFALPGQKPRVFNQGEWMIQAVLSAPAIGPERPVRTTIRIPRSIVIIAEDLPVDRIATDDRKVTIEYLKSIFGKPDRETETYLDYKKQNGLGFYLRDYLIAIHLNPGFKGHLENGITMESTLGEIFEAFGQPIRTEETEDLRKDMEERVLYRRGNIGRISYRNVTFWLKNDNINQIAIGPCYLISAKAYDEARQKVEVDNKLQAEDLAAEGWRLWRQRKLPEAEEKFKQAIKKDPTNDNAFQGLGWAQLNQGKKLNAKESFEKCIEINPSNAAALNGLGWIAYGAGKKDEAITWWEKAITAAPGATASLSGLTKVYMERKDYGKAVKYYQMWLNAEPGSAQAKSGLEKAKSALQHK